MKKELTVSGEVDYDFEHDVLFFKASGRDYSRSIELDSVVLDIDQQGFITGFQVFDASNFFNLDKSSLLKIPRWRFQTNVHNNRIEVRLHFVIEQRNKVIEKNPIIMQSLTEPLPDSELVCEIG